MAFVAARKISHRILWPLVGFGQQDTVFVLFVDVLAELFEECVRLRQVRAIGALAFLKIRHRVQPEAVDA
jgi:hypothetical protein